MVILADSQYYYLILFALRTISTLLLIAFSRKPVDLSTHHHHVTLPPSPPSLPIIGHLHLLSSQLNKSVQQLSSKYGPLLFLRFGFYKCVLVSSAPLAAQIFKANDVALSGKPMSPFEEKLMFGRSGFFTAQHGEYWKFMKKLCVTELLRSQQIHKFRGTRREEVSRMLLRIVEKALKREAVDLHEEFIKLTSAAFCRMANIRTKQTEGAGEAEMCLKLVLDTLDATKKMNMANPLGPAKDVMFWMYGKQMEDVMGRFDAWLEVIIQEHEEAARIGGWNRQDMIDILLETHYDAKAEVRITKTQIKAFFVDIFMAGTITTADTILWAIAELINHPDIFNKVREEIESVVGKDKLVEETDIPKLHYLHDVVKEALRLYPPSSLIPRACSQDCKFGDFHVPRGTVVLVNCYAMMRDPNLWDNPDQFCPERFLTPLPEDKGGTDRMKEVTRPDFSFLPFGVGRRMCPGSGLALSIMHLAIASAVQCFDWEVESCGGKVNMEAKGNSIVTTMLHPLVCVPKVHFNPFGN